LEDLEILARSPMQLENQPGDQLDLLWGARAIAAFLDTTERKVWYYADRGYLPVRRQGRLIIARKSELRKHFAAAEAPTTPPSIASETTPVR
jgi:hypothetical protein